MHQSMFCLQDYESIVKLVETLEKLPTFDPVAHPHVKFHYAFALNRWDVCVCVMCFWIQAFMRCLLNLQHIINRFD